MDSWSPDVTKILKLELFIFEKKTFLFSVFHAAVSNAKENIYTKLSEQKKNLQKI